MSENTKEIELENVNYDDRIAKANIGKSILAYISALPASYNYSEYNLNKIYMDLENKMQKLIDNSVEIRLLAKRKIQQNPKHYNATIYPLEKQYYQQVNQRIASFSNKKEINNKQYSAVSTVRDFLEKMHINPHTADVLGKATYGFDVCILGDTYLEAYKTNDYELAAKKTLEVVISDIAGILSTRAISQMIGAAIVRAAAIAGSRTAIAAAILITFGAVPFVVGFLASYVAGIIFESAYNTIKKWLFGVDRVGEYYQIDPLVLDLNADGIKTIGIGEVEFDHRGEGEKIATAWISSDDGLLVRDIDNDGKITSGKELFGDNTILSNGEKAQHGFEALADLDSNNDGKINKDDEKFRELKVWIDANSNAETEEGELKTLQALGIKEFDLNYNNTNRELEAGNTISQTSTFTKEDDSIGELADVNFVVEDNYINQFIENITASDNQKIRPNLAGSGRVADLNKSADKSKKLAEILDNYTNANTKEEQLALLDNLILEWAKTDKLFAGFLMVSFLNPTKTSSSGRGLTPNQINMFGTISEKYTERSRKNITKIHILDSFSNTRTNTAYVVNDDEAEKFFDIVEESYSKLREKVYQGLLLQTRLKSYLQKINLKFTEEDFSFDYSEVKNKFLEINANNSKKAFVDLGEFIFFCELGDNNQILRNLFIEFLANAQKNSQLKDYLEILGDEITKYLVSNKGTNQSEIIVAEENNSEEIKNLKLGAGDDILVDAKGNQIYEGEFGSDCYIFSKGQGQDIIRDYDYHSGNRDKIKFLDVNSSEAKFFKDANHLIISYSNNDSVKVEDFFTSNDFKIEVFEFADKTITIEELRTNGFELYNPENNTNLNAWNDKAILKGNDNSETIKGSQFDDVICGNGGNDFIKAWSGNDTIIGGLGNDRLEGEFGSDIYVFSKGHGQDVIRDYDYHSGNRDKIKFLDVNSSEAKFFQDGNHLIISYNNSDSVKVEDFFTSNDFKIEVFEFADKTITIEELRANGFELYNPENNTNLNAWNDKAILKGNDNSETIKGSQFDDVIYGNGGNDFIKAGSGNDTIIGGIGDDRLEGEFGSDCYVFSKGHGQDTIRDYDYHSGNKDKIKFLDVKFEEVKFVREGNNLFITGYNDGDYVKIEDFFSSSDYKIEIFEFTDKIISSEEIANIIAIN